MLSKLGYGIDEFCNVVGVGRSLVYEEIREGRLRARKAGRRTIITADDGHAWLKALPEARSDKPAAA